jgi:hypothetical protein
MGSSNEGQNKAGKGQVHQRPVSSLRPEKRVGQPNFKHHALYNQFCVAPNVHLNCLVVCVLALQWKSCHLGVFK